MGEDEAPRFWFDRHYQELRRPLLQDLSAHFQHLAHSWATTWLYVIVDTTRPDSGDSQRKSQHLAGLLSARVGCA